MAIPKKPNLTRNAIAEQIKTSANSLTIQEWNQVINILKQQTNLNTSYLETLHRALFYDYDTNSSGTVTAFDSLLPGALANVIEALPNATASINAIGIDIAELEQTLTDLHTTLNTTIENIPRFFFGDTEPDSSVIFDGDLWYDTHDIPNNITFDDPADTVFHDDTNVGIDLPSSALPGDEYIKLS